MPADKPTALGKEIGRRLRFQRQHARLNEADLSRRLGWTTTKTSRTETGIRNMSETEIVMYMASCGAGQTEVDDVVALASQRSRYRAIDHTDTIRDATDTLGFHEGQAVTIEGYEPTCVPALVRTEQYARALLIEAGICSSPVVEHRLEGLNQRQSILKQSRQPNYTWYIHENTLHTPVGDNLIMSEQLMHLTFLSAWNRCTIRIIPRTAKSTGLIKNGFQLLTFTDIAPLATLDLETNALLLDHPDDTGRYRAALNRLDQVALSNEQSTTLIANMADTYDGAQHVNLPAKTGSPLPADEAPDCGRKQRTTVGEHQSSALH
jgi:hypothetical protein